MANWVRTCLLLVAVLAVNAEALSDVCYSYLGCFSMSDPWFSPLRPVPAPQAPDAIDTQFHLYNRAQPNRYVIGKLPTISVAGSKYDGSKPTFFLIQGFYSNGSQTWVLDMKDAVLKEFDANVIIVDWSKGSMIPNYLQVVGNSRVVAAEITRLGKYLVASKGAAASRFHLVGHSIGAHIAGYVGKAIPGVARITALDAAPPGFDGYPDIIHLTKNDAVFVEAIHTNARPILFALGYGILAPFGHVDFYVNGGFNQPGCDLAPVPAVNFTSLESLSTVDFVDAMRVYSCNHDRSYQVFTSAVANKGFPFWGHTVDYAVLYPIIAIGGDTTQLLTFAPCTKLTCSPLGLQTTIYPARGVFVVKTTGTSPYYIAEPASDVIMTPFKTKATATV